MKSSAALNMAKPIIRWLRWATVLALVYSALGEISYSAMGPYAIRPAPLTAMQHLVFSLGDHALRQAAFVAAGAIIAPRFRLTTALVLAVSQVAFSFWGHVLSTGGPWLSWTANYRHFGFEALGSMLGVVYVYWSEKAHAQRR